MAADHSVQLAALDGLVSVNSVFTVAVFIGLSLATPGQKSLEGGGACDAGEDIVKDLIIFEVVSFSSFLFSSLLAQGLKLAITIIDRDEQVNNHMKLLRTGILASALGSVTGCVFLMLSMISVIQITLGILPCRLSSTLSATITLVALVSTATAIYITTVLYAFTR